jgi:endoglucanase
MGQTMNIFLNQLGYYPGSRKIAIVKYSNSSSFEILRSKDGKIIFTGRLSPVRYYSESEDSVKMADFSTLQDQGEYIIKVGEMKSVPFRISSYIFRDIAYASLRTFYYQRCSCDLVPEYAGIWARHAGHPDTSVIFHYSTGRSGRGSSPKGWYDAGDYNKYVVNAGISVATLLQFYELFPFYFADSTLSIPESGNKINDLLDEVRYEFDWLATMQDVDGGVFNKVTTLKFCGFIMPEKDTAQRYFVGKSTAATLDFAAMMAMAARIYRPFDNIFSANCLMMAKNAWVWAIKNPAIEFKNPPDVYTGDYGDKTFDDEFLWAASELYITTGDTEYSKFLLSRSSIFRNYSVPEWPNVASLGFQSLATIKNNLDSTVLSTIRNAIVERCKILVNEISNNPFRLTNTKFSWGCNGSFAQAGVTLIYGFLLTRDSAYLYAADELADYLLGKNATGYSFFTFYGAKSVMNPHHRPSYSDNIVMPIPGFLAGGPNPGRQDRAPYAYLQPAKSYSDVMESYASNEVAINWNSPATFLLAALDCLHGDRNQYVYKPIDHDPNCPPVISITYPIFGSKVSDKDSMVVNFTLFDDENKISSVEIYLDSRYLATLPVNTEKFELPLLKSGNHVVSIYAVDKHNKIGEKSTRFVVSDHE